MATTSINEIDHANVNECTSMELANQLLNLIKKLINEKRYDEIPLLFTKDKEANNNLSHLSKISMNVFTEICQLALTDENHEQDLSLYNCAEGLLTLMASYAPFEEFLLELLELIEDNQSEYVFTSSLQALQVLLLRSNTENPRAIEWSLNSIRTRVNELPLPSFLKTGYDPDQEKLLEQNEEIHNLLMYYVTIGLFYEPLVTDIGENSHPKESFRPLGATPSNVLCCFLLNLLGKPLSLLDLTNNGDRKTNSYSLQCAKSLAQAVTRCIGDPYFFLPMIEHRLRTKCFNKLCNHEYQPDMNIFLRHEVLPIDALAVYYYMLIAENVDSNKIPTVYDPLFVFESVMHLVNELLCCEEPALHGKGLKLTKSLLRQLDKREIPSDSLELSVHKTFCLTLCNLVSYSTQLHLRREGVVLLRQYILQFECSARYIILRNLMRTISHDGIAGYLAITYKDIVAETLIANKTSILPETFSSEEFRSVFLQNICKLPHGIETDILEHSHRIISTLNTLRFFAINDSHNRTGFWDFIGVVERNYFTTLRKSLDISIAHCKQKLYSIENGCDGNTNEPGSNDDCDSLKLLNLTIANDVDNENKKVLPISKLNQEENMYILKQNLCTYDLIRSLLVRANECIEYQIKNVCPLDDVNLLLNCRYLVTVAQNQHYRRNASIYNCKNLIPKSKSVLLAPTIKHHSLCTKPSKDTKSTNLNEFARRESKSEEENQQTQNEDNHSDEAKINEARSQILEAALVHTPTLGWTREAIAQGAVDIGYAGVVHGMFPEGGFALVSYFTSKCNENLVQQMQTETKNGQKEISNPLEFLVRFVRIRLEMLIPYIDQWPQALALITLPQNTTTALAQTLTLVDDICYYSGDRSVNIGWYTRRIGLATILKITEFYMLQDKSSHYCKTWEFLRNRMEEAVQLELMYSQKEDMTNKFQSSFKSAFVTARNILGLGYSRP